MIYLIFVIPFLFTSIVDVIQNKRNNIILTLSAVFLILFAGLRDGVGTDWPAYKHFYQYGVDNVEIGYAFINNFFKSLDFPFYIFLIFINFISIGLITKASIKLSAIPILSLLIYYSDLYFYFNFSGMRQALALSIIIFSLTYSFGPKRNIYIFLGLILCAITFHISSIIFSLAYFIPRRKLNKKEYIILLVSFTFFSSLVYLASSFLTGIFAAKAEFYLEHQEQSTNIIVLFSVGLARRLIPIILILFFGKNQILENKLSAYLFNLYLIGFGIYATTYLISPDIGVRMSVYFTVLEMFLLANLVYLVKRTDIKFIVLLIIFAVAIYKISTYLNYPAYEYNWIIDKI